MGNDVLTLKDEIANRYRQMIHSGRFRQGDRLPTVREVADELRVSITPVRAAYSILADEGLIASRGAAGTYVGVQPTNLPASLEIGVLFRQVRGWTEDDNYALQLLTGVQEALQSKGHRTILSALPRSQSDWTAAADHLAAGHPHGYLVDELAPDSVVERLVATGRPVAVVNRPSPGVSAAHSDWQGAGETAAKAVLKHGHRVAACLWRDTVGGRATAEAFLRVMAENGCTLPAAHVSEAKSSASPEEPFATFLRVLSCPPVPTVVFCTDDRIARPFCAWAKDRGLRVPQDVSVVGVMDLAMAARNDPPLSTFHFHPEAVGRAAVEELIAQCRQPSQAPRTITVPGEWVERQSLAHLVSQ